MVAAVGDDLMSATRYGVMMLRRAKEPPGRAKTPIIPPFRPTDPTMGMLG